MTERSKRVWRKRRKKRTYHAHSTVLNLDKRLQDQSIKFDTDSSTIICDNSANAHICNDKTMFISPPCRTDQHYAATIGGAKNSATGMGTTRWRWKDDGGKQHMIDVVNVLYLPQSPLNILSITSLADHFNYDDGTGINNKLSKSHFYWNHNKHQRTITHTPSKLPVRCWPWVVVLKTVQQAWAQLDCAGKMMVESSIGLTSIMFFISRYHQWISWA